MSALSAEQTLVEEDTQRGRFLTFALGNEVCGLEINCVREIVGMQPITVMPESPNYVKGIINLRGRIIPVVDARLKFGMEEAQYTNRTCIIIIETGDDTVGLIVDGVSEVLIISDDNIVPLPAHSTGVQNSYLKAVGKVKNDVKLLLDCEKLFGKQELAI